MFAALRLEGLSSPMTSPEADTRAEAEAILARIAASSDADIDLAEGALALAALDRPQVSLARSQGSTTFISMIFSSPSPPRASSRQIRRRTRSELCF